MSVKMEIILVISMHFAQTPLIITIASAETVLLEMDLIAQVKQFLFMLINSIKKSTLRK